MFFILKRKTGRYIKSNKYLFLLIFTFICAGAISGTFGALRSENIQDIKLADMDKNQIILSSFLENTKHLAWILLWGMNGVGIPFIIYLLYQKGAYISAAVYSVLALESANKFVALLSIIPFIACTILSVVCLSQASIEYSYAMFRGTIFKSVQPKRNCNTLKLALSFLISVGLAFLGGLAETLVKVNIT